MSLIYYFLFDLRPCLAEALAEAQALAKKIFDLRPRVAEALAEAQVLAKKIFDLRSLSEEDKPISTIVLTAAFVL